MKEVWKLASNKHVKRLLVLPVIGVAGCNMPSSPQPPVYAQPIIMKLPSGQESLLGANLPEGVWKGNQTDWFQAPPTLNGAPQTVPTANNTPYTTTVPVTTTVDVPKEIKGHFANERVGTGADCATKRVWIPDHKILVPTTEVIQETVSVPAPAPQPTAIANGNLAPAKVTQTAGNGAIIAWSVGEVLTGAGNAASGAGAIIFAKNYKPDTYNSTVNAVNDGVSATGGDSTGATASATGGTAKANGGSSNATGGNAANDNNIVDTNSSNNQNYNNQSSTNQNYNNQNQETWSTNNNSAAANDNGGPPPPSGKPCVKPVSSLSMN